MKKRIARGLSLALALCVLLSTFTGTVFAATGTANKQVTFTGLTAERGSLSSYGFNNMANVPNTSNEAHKPYLGFYTWGPANGLFGKGADDTALRFTSEWSSANGAIPGNKGSATAVSGWDWPLNPWTLHNVGLKELGEDDRVHISFEYARDGGSSNGYMQFRTYTSTGGSTVKQDNNFFGIKSSGATSDSVSMFGEVVTMDFGTWHQFDYIIYPKYNTAAAGEAANYAVAADLYFDGKLIKAKKIIYSDLYLTGIEGVRITFDPRKVGTEYPQTNSYIDNYSHKLFTASDTAPAIAKTELTHNDTTLNSYIDNENRVIDYYGQTVQEMVDGLNVPSGSAATVVDKAGNSLSGSAPLLDCYVRIAKNYGDGYYSGYDTYTVRNMKRLVTGSSMVNIDLNGSTIPDVYAYTSVGDLLDSLTVEEGAAVKMLDSSDGEVSHSAMVANGMKVVATKAGADDEVYPIGTVHGKVIDLDFDGWNYKYYYGNPDGNKYNGTSFGGPALEEGQDPSEVAYVEYIEEPGRGTVMHSYSNSNYSTQSSYSHMNIMYTVPAASELGTKFVMEMSAKVGPSGSIASQVKYTTKAAPATAGFLNPINFSEKNISVMNQVVKDNCVQGNWYDVKAFCDTDTGRLVVFINGDKVFDDTNATVASFNAFTDMRLIQHFYAKDTVKEAWVDDFRIYGVGGLTDSFLATMDTKLTSDMLTVEGSYISGFAGMSAQQLLDAVTVSAGASKKVYMADGLLEVDGSTLVETGMIIRVTSPDGSSKKNYILNVADAIIGEISYTTNGVATNGKFAVGTVAASVDVDSYVTSGIPLALVIAQYEGDRLINIAVEDANVTAKGKTTVSTSLEVTKAEGTTMSILLLDGLGTIRPLKKSIDLTPFSSEKIETVAKLYPGYVNKAVTLSFDDLNPTQDARFIDILNKNGLKGTFNLKTANFISKPESVQQSYVEMYRGHEVANHTRNHKRMNITDPSDPEYQTLQFCKDDILNGQNDIAARFGVTPEGLIWPFGSARNRSDYPELLAYIKSLGVKYIRPVETTGGFALPSDWYDWRATCHHDGANNYVDTFLALPDNGGEVDDLKLFYIWGHTYEFDETFEPDKTSKLRWNDIEALCKKLGDAENVWSATNLEVYNYVEALKKIEINSQTNQVVNPTDVDLYVQINGINTMVPAHGVAGL